MKKGYSLIHVIFIILFTSVISGITVGVILTKSDFSEAGLSYSDVLNDKEIQEFLRVYSELTNKYYKDVDKKDLVNHIIDSMAEYFNETYTSLLDEDASNRLIDQINGTYRGIGITTVDNIVIYVESNSPAYNAGIMENDIITHINNESVSGKSNNEISSMIVSEDKVNVRILRHQAEMDFELDVEHLDMPSAYYRVLSNKIGYIRINTFSKTASQLVKNAVDYYNNQKITKVIIDVRDNPGGYLKYAREIAQLFTKNGEKIYSIVNQENFTDYKDNDDIYNQFDIVVLVNKQTASAAEVLAAALHDNGHALLIGEKTYGKGKVQHLYTLDNGNTLKYTSAIWYTPLGYSIDEVGIMPDYYIENGKIYSDDDKTIIDIKDLQLKYGHELLIKK